MSNPLRLAVSGLIDAERAFATHLSALDWNEIDVMRLKAVDPEIVNFSEIVPLEDLRVGMVRV
jgi:hypothetical protein